MVRSDRLPHSMGETSLTMRLLRLLGSPLETGDPAATIDRLFHSKHVKDLQLIVAVAFLGVILILFIGLVLSFENEVHSQPSQATADWIHIGFSAAGKFLTFFVPVLAVFGGILAWAYQVGSARLGVVDLFACEISTLCRVATVVDTVRRYAHKFEIGPHIDSGDTARPPARSFTSQENYFPVFENNTRDLQALEARVVIDVTEFYTYMKAFRDSLRALVQIEPQPSELVHASNKPDGDGCWHAAIINIVYMLFLGMESARHAIANLVEFQPEWTERTIVILISELEAYRFLRNRFPDEDDMRHRRIMLREPEYRILVQQLRCKLLNHRTMTADSAPHQSGEASQWEGAWQLLPTLMTRFEAATAV